MAARLTDEVYNEARDIVDQLVWSIAEALAEAKRKVRREIAADRDDSDPK